MKNSEIWNKELAFSNPKGEYYIVFITKNAISPDFVKLNLKLNFSDDTDSTYLKRFRSVNDIEGIIDIDYLSHNSKHFVIISLIDHTYDVQIVPTGNFTEEPVSIEIHVSGFVAHWSQRIGDYGVKLARFFAEKMPCLKRGSYSAKILFGPDQSHKHLVFNIGDSGFYFNEQPGALVDDRLTILSRRSISEKRESDDLRIDAISTIDSLGEEFKENIEINSPAGLPNIGNTCFM